MPNCPHCGQVIQDSHKEVLNKHKLNMLQYAGRSIISSQKNDFDLHEKLDDTNFYNNFQKLRYSGLIFHVGKRGHWGLTRNAWSFLRGELKLPKWIIIRNNHIVERSAELIGVKDVYRGAEIIDTVFEYFDDNGNMIGARPVEPSAKQEMLFNIPVRRKSWQEV